MPKPEYCDSKTRIGSLITGAIEIVYFLSSLFTDYPWPLKRFCVKSQMVSFGDTHSYQFTNAELFVSFERMETLRIRASKERTAGQKNLTWNMKAVVSPGGTLPIMAQHEIDKKTSCFSDLFPRRAFLSRFMKRGSIFQWKVHERVAICLWKLCIRKGYLFCQNCHIEG